MDWNQIYEEFPVYQKMFDKLSDAVYFLDQKGRYIYVNKIAAKLDGYQKEDFYGKTVPELYEISLAESPIMQCVQNGQEFIDRYVTYYCNGRKISQIINVMPIKENGRMMGIIAIQRDVTKLEETLEKNIELQKIVSAANNSPNGINNHSLFRFGNMIGEDTTFLTCKIMADNAAKRDSSIMLTGKTGTGKEIFAQSIHNASSRSNGPFLAINCAAIPESLLESILFGTTKGIYTGALEREGVFEQARGGTLFLDEINSMAPESQTKLLRVLEERQVQRLGGKRKYAVNTRIISSTNVMPEEALDKKMIREDLFYRLAVVDIMLPSLQDRGNDIMLLSRFFIDKYNKEFCRNIVGLHDEVKDFFMTYPWPGNVRQLKHCIECAMNIVSQDEKYILMHHLPAYIVNGAFVYKKKVVSSEVTPAVPEKKTTDSIFSDIQNGEKNKIIEVLYANNGNVSKAARVLGMPRYALAYRLKKYHIK